MGGTGGCVQAGVTWTRQDRRLWAHFRQGLLTRVWLSALRPRYVHDRVRAAEAKRELCAAPQRLPRAPVFSRKPRSLCRKPARHKIRRSGCAAIMHGACAPEEPEAAFPRAEVEREVGDPIQPPPWRRATEQADVAMTTRKRVLQIQR